MAVEQMSACTILDYSLLQRRDGEKRKGRSESAHDQDKLRGRLHGKGS